MTEPRYDVIAIGNAIVDVMAPCSDELIDELQLNKGGMTLVDDEGAAMLYDAMGPAREISGGSAANTLAGMAALGAQCAFIGQVAKDQLGDVFSHDIRAVGIDFDTPSRDGQPSTARCLIFVTPDGERSFTSPKIITADETLRVEEVDLSQIDRAEMMLFGTNQMVTPKLRDAAMLALRTAHNRDRFVAFDPNIRLHLWDDTRRVLPCMNEAIPNVDLVKLNDEEIEMLGRGMSAEQLYTEWFEPAGVTALIATYASGGAEVFCGDFRLSVDAPNVEVVDTTGAGDGFVAGVLSAICGLTEDMKLRSSRALRARLRAWDEETWRHILNLGCFVGSHVCTTLGATTGLPTLDQVPKHLSPKGSKVPVTQACLAEVKSTT